MQLRILLYLNAKDLITLCYVSKYFKKLVLKQFNKHYDISTGFCAVSFWAKKFEENVFKLIEAIHSELFDTFAFDFEENYDKLIKKSRRLSLFSVCLHFLRCRRSCEKLSACCKMCSRVRENTFYEYNAFLSLKVRSNTEDNLNISSLERADLDVFLTKLAHFPYYFTEPSDKCSDFEVISFAQDLFAAFSSVLVRMYLNIATEYFSDLISQLNLSDEKRVVRKIFTSAHQILYRFFDLNYLFFYECFDLFGQLNGTDCFAIRANKPKHGPYHGPKCTLEVIMF